MKYLIFLKKKDVELILHCKSTKPSLTYVLEHKVLVQREGWLEATIRAMMANDQYMLVKEIKPDIHYDVK